MEIAASLLFPLLIALFVALVALSWSTDSRPMFDERRDGERFGSLR